MSKIVFLLPSKSRPSKFFFSVENIIENCVQEDYEIISVLDKSDETMNTGEVFEKLLEYPKLKPFYMDTTGKIDAINKGLLFLPTDTKVIVVTADDIVFIEKGIDAHIETDMQQLFPDYSGLIHYPDQQAKERQITMPVMGIKLVNKLGYIYHKDFISVWCDNFQLAQVKKMKKYKFVNKKLYEHRHPAWGLSENDDLYKKNESFYHLDKETFFRLQQGLPA